MTSRLNSQPNRRASVSFQPQVFTFESMPSRRASISSMSNRRASLSSSSSSRRISISSSTLRRNSPSSRRHQSLSPRNANRTISTHRRVGLLDRPVGYTCPPVVSHIWDLFATRVNQHSNNPFLKSVTADKVVEDLSYGQVSERVCLMASFFQQIGISDNTRVAILSEGSVFMIHCLFSLWALDITPVMFSYKLPVETLHKLYFEVRVGSIIVSRKYLHIAHDLKRLNTELSVYVMPVTWAENSCDYASIASSDILIENNVFSATQKQRFAFEYKDSDSLGLILHTTGTTNLPKIVPLSHLNIIMQCEGCREIYDLNNIGGGDVNFLYGTPFHVLFLVMNLCHSVYYGTACALPVTEPSLLSVSDFFLHLRTAQTSYCILVSSYIIGWRLIEMQEQENACDGAKLEISKYISRMKHIGVGGGHVPKDVMTFWAERGANMQNVYGATETSGLTMVSEPGGDILNLRPLKPFTEYCFYRTKPQIGAKIAELVFYNLPCALSGYLFPPEANKKAFSDIGEFYSCDLVEIDDITALSNVSITESMGSKTCIHQGRADHVLLHSNGEMTNPVPIEAELVANVLIKAAIIVGDNRPYCACFLQLNWDRVHSLQNTAHESNSVDEILSQLRQFAVDCSLKFAQWSSLTHRMIHILESTQKLPTTPKNFIDRKMFYVQYAEAIEQLYGASVVDIDDRGSAVYTLDTLRVVLREAIANVLGIPLSDINCEKSLSQLGMGSFQGAELFGVIQSIIPGVKISLMDVLGGRSVSKLLDKLVSSYEQSTSSTCRSNDCPTLPPHPSERKGSSQSLHLGSRRSSVRIVDVESEMKPDSYTLAAYSWLQNELWLDSVAKDMRVDNYTVSSLVNMHPHGARFRVYAALEHVVASHSCASLIYPFAKPDNSCPAEISRRQSRGLSVTSSLDIVSSGDEPFEVKVVQRKSWQRFLDQHISAEHASKRSAVTAYSDDIDIEQWTQFARRMMNWSRILYCLLINLDEEHTEEKRPTNPNSTFIMILVLHRAFPCPINLVWKQFLLALCREPSNSCLPGACIARSYPMCWPMKAPKKGPLNPPVHNLFSPLLERSQFFLNETIRHCVQSPSKLVSQTIGYERFDFPLKISGERLENLFLVSNNLNITFGSFLLALFNVVLRKSISNKELSIWTPMSLLLDSVDSDRENTGLSWKRGFVPVSFSNETTQSLEDFVKSDILRTMDELSNRALLGLELPVFSLTDFSIRKDASVRPSSLAFSFEDYSMSAGVDKLCKLNCVKQTIIKSHSVDLPLFDLMLLADFQGDKSVLNIGFVANCKVISQIGVVRIAENMAELLLVLPNIAHLGLDQWVLPHPPLVDVYSQIAKSPNLYCLKSLLPREMLQVKLYEQNPLSLSQAINVSWGSNLVYPPESFTVGMNSIDMPRFIQNAVSRHHKNDENIVDDYLFVHLYFYRIKDFVRAKLGRYQCVSSHVRDHWLHEINSFLPLDISCGGTHISSKERLQTEAYSIFRHLAEFGPATSMFSAQDYQAFGMKVHENLSLYAMNSAHVFGDATVAALCFSFSRIIKYLNMFFPLSMVDWLVKSMFGVSNRDQYTAAYKKEYSLCKHVIDKHYWLGRIKAGPSTPALIDFGSSGQFERRNNAFCSDLFSVPTVTMAGIRRLTEKMGGTIFVTVLALFSAFLCSEYDVEDFIITYPVNARPLSASICTGFHVNTLYLRAQIHAQMSFMQVLSFVQERRWNDRFHQRFPLDCSKDFMVIPSNVACAQSVFNLPLPGVDKTIVVTRVDPKIDLALLFDFSSTELIFMLQGRESLFPSYRHLQKLQEAFLSFVSRAIDEPDECIGSFSGYIAEEQYTTLQSELPLAFAIPSLKESISSARQASLSGLDFEALRSPAHKQRRYSVMVPITKDRRGHVLSKTTAIRRADVPRENQLLKDSSVTTLQFHIYEAQMASPDLPIMQTPVCFIFQGPIRIPTFQLAYAWLLRSTRAMGTVFRQDGESKGIGMRYVSPDPLLPFIDCSCLRESDHMNLFPTISQLHSIDEHKLDEETNMSDLEQVGLKNGDVSDIIEYLETHFANRAMNPVEPMIESYLFRTRDIKNCVWYFNTHLLIADGRSVQQLLFQRIQSIYLSLLHQRPGVLSQDFEQLPAIEACARLSFGSFLERELAFRSSADYLDHRQYWHHKLSTHKQSSSYLQSNQTSFYGLRRTAIGMEKAIKLELSFPTDLCDQLIGLTYNPLFETHSMNMSLDLIMLTVIVAWMRESSRENHGSVAIGVVGNIRNSNTAHCYGNMSLMRPLFIPTSTSHTFTALFEVVREQFIEGIPYSSVSVGNPEHIYDVAFNHVPPRLKGVQFDSGTALVEQKDLRPGYEGESLNIEFRLDEFTHEASLELKFQPAVFPFASLRHRVSAILLRLLYRFIREPNAVITPVLNEFTSLHSLSENYWNVFNSSRFPLPSIPIDFKLEATHSKKNHHTIVVCDSKCADLENLAVSVDTSLDTLLLGIAAIVVDYWNEFMDSRNFSFAAFMQQDECMDDNFSEPIGKFNSVLFNVDIDRKQTLLELIQDLAEQRIASLKYRFLSSDEVIGTRSGNDGCLFSFGFFANYLSSFRCPTHLAADIYLTVYRNSENHLVLDLSSQTRYRLSMIRDMLNTMYDFIEKLTTATFSSPIMSELSSFLSLPEETTTIRTLVNCTDNIPVPSHCLHYPVLKQIVTNPNGLALVCGEHRITYRELGEMTHSLAGKLMKHIVIGTQPELIGIVMDKSWQQVVAVLAILHCGCAYTPISASHPEEHIFGILKHSGITYVIVEDSIHRFNWPHGITSISMHSSVQDNLSPNSLVDEQELLKVVSRIHSLAYVIFTSGSTGQPKGVMISHSSAVNTIEDVNHRFKISNRDVTIAISQLHFDLSVWDIFGTLGVGGTLVIPNSHETTNPELMLKLVVQEGVTVWNSVPAFIKMLNRCFPDCPKDLTFAVSRSLRLVMMSGDFIPPDTPDIFRSFCPDTVLISMGGATEAAIWSILFEIPRPVPTQWATIPYGYPLANQQWAVFQHGWKECPNFVLGELHIAGVGLALGYFDDIEKTNQSFVVHPTTKQRWYKTGDLGYYTADGCLMICGRKDFQVKINGYRVELEDIQVHLSKHTAVMTSCVVAVKLQPDSKEMTLVAYICLKGQRLQYAKYVKNIEAHLINSVPSYMVPRVYVILKDLPLTPIGKVNRKYLQGNQMIARLHQARQYGFWDEDDTCEILDVFCNVISDYTEPDSPADCKFGSMFTPTESAIVELLGEYIDSETDPRKPFFELGVMSMGLMELQARLKLEFDLGTVPISVLWDSNVTKVAAWVDDALIRQENPDSLLSAQTADGQSGNCCLLLNESCDGTPVFLINGAGGVMSVLDAFANELTSTGHSAYAPNFNDTISIDGDNSVYDMAANVVDAIMSTVAADFGYQDPAVYILVGFCVGGNVAYEACRMLQQLGKSVQLVIADAYPSCCKPKPLWLRFNLYVRDMSGLTALDVMQPFLENAGVADLKGLLHPRTAFNKQSLDDKLITLKQSFEMAGLTVSSIDDLKNSFLKYVAILNAVDSYRVSSKISDILSLKTLYLIQATNTDADISEDPIIKRNPCLLSALLELPELRLFRQSYLGWNKYFDRIGANYQLAKVRGHHYNFSRKPMFAQKLTAFIDDIESTFAHNPSTFHPPPLPRPKRKLMKRRTVSFFRVPLLLLILSFLYYFYQMRIFYI